MRQGVHHTQLFRDFVLDLLHRTSLSREEVDDFDGDGYSIARAEVDRSRGSLAQFLHKFNFVSIDDRFGVKGDIGEEPSDGIVFQVRVQNLRPRYSMFLLDEQFSRYFVCDVQMLKAS